MCACVCERDRERGLFVGGEDSRVGAVKYTREVQALRRRMTAVAFLRQPTPWYILG